MSKLPASESRAPKARWFGSEDRTFGMEEGDDQYGFHHRVAKKGFGSKVNLSTAFHPQTDGQAERTIHTLEDMLRACVIDFKGNWDDQLPLIEFTYNNSYHSSIQMAPYKALYGIRCRSPIGWFEVGKAGLIGPDLVHQAMKKVKVIQERLKTAQSRPKSYIYVRRRALEFEVDDWVYLKVSPMKGVMRFRKKGKLSPRYIGPYRIVKRIGNVAYELELPQELAAVHPVFHISMLKKCIGGPSLILPTESIRIKNSLSYEEIPVLILDRQVRRFRTKDVASVKVLWRNQFVEEDTWEAEEDMNKRYPYLFESGGNADQVKRRRRGEREEQARISSWFSSVVIPIKLLVVLLKFLVVLVHVSGCDFELNPLYPGSASSTPLIQLSTPESVVSAELRKPGQGFSWGLAMAFECRPHPGCRLGA
ncbi:hypothetical protein KY289_026501 [Solanum tuberosum]|nr:hypothetical protein KY289_026501 [Solanum tuberosum]